MSLRFLLSLAIATCVLIVTSEAVVGGSETKVQKVPYQVSIRRKSCSTCAFEQFASGAIYSKNIIITSASSVRKDTPQTLMVVAATSHRTASEGIVLPVQEIVIHENFDQLSLDNDIALLKLKVDLPMRESTLVQALKIAEVEPAVGAAGAVAGWGKTSELGDYSETLRRALVPIASRESCQRAHQFSVISANMICAGLEKGGADACKGDGGSPLVVANEFVGLVSWGVGCARPNSPGVYTNLVQLREWINEAVENLVKN